MAFIAISFLTAFAWAVKLYYQRQVEPDSYKKKPRHPLGQIMMEIWPANGGQRQYHLRPIMPGGREVLAPHGTEDALRYFFTRSSITYKKFPAWLPFDSMKADVPTASWYESHSVAIDPEVETVEITDTCPACHAEITLTQDVVIAKDAIPPDLQARIRDTDALSAGDEVLQDGKERDELISKALRGGNLKTYLYLALGAAAIAAALDFMTYQQVTDIAAKLGI
jgi:hypothetical protein